MNPPRRFIDANVFVYLLSADPRYSEKALEILEAAEKGLYEAYTSTLAVSQVLAHLERRRRGRALGLFLSYLEDSPVAVVETTWHDFLEARRLAEENKLLLHSMWDDLVIAAQMKRLGVEEIYSNDRDFDRVPGIRRLF